MINLTFIFQGFGTLAQNQPQYKNVGETNNNVTVTKHGKINMNLSLQVAKKVLDITPSVYSKNMVCSPFSITTILNTLVAGAKGKTLEQLLSLLDYNNMEDVNAIACRMESIARSNNIHGKGPIIASANGVWLDRRFSLNPSYKELLQSYAYQTQLKVVDFQDQVIHKCQLTQF